ncbi:hypothetical protein PCC7424_1852 [Gloeothece citriformis PCC 7424]|uniref:Uncharacterized protein n=1 Tax=Gloeothece citriformis (strain PCC 7424) TaxID=65393 RepID=B7KCH9_GLOC7|nr:hypothetical protein [Gloeothece citriformis]ACK70284.1 hypothetical protein PCC7424_1852 [Gloeothece citriformis PCC 7424]
MSNPQKTEKETLIKWLELGLKLIEIVVIGGLGIYISYKAHQISVSIDRGTYLNSSIENLSKSEREKIRQDISLVVLDKTLTVYPEQNIQKDLVYKIAVIVGNDLILKSKNGIHSGNNTQNLTQKRNDIYNDLLQVRTVLLNRVSPYLTPEDINILKHPEVKTPEEINKIFKKLATILTQDECEELKRVFILDESSTITGINLVYIQYKTDKNKAEKLQKYLQSQNIVAPDIEQISGIEGNDIRYSNSGDLQTAKKLQKILQDQEKITIPDENLIDLSKAGYKVPPGQFEIWLK